jgi:hypothetical protein
VASIWCIINLTWDDPDNEERIKVLREMDKRLEYLSQFDENVDVRDRAKIALINFGTPV